jgi:hypothetical protein
MPVVTRRKRPLQKLKCGLAAGHSVIASTSIPRWRLDSGLPHAMSMRATIARELNW